MRITTVLTMMACLGALMLVAPRPASAMPAAHVGVAHEASLVTKAGYYHCRYRRCGGRRELLARWVWKNNYNGPYYFYNRGYYYPYYPGYGFYQHFGR